MFFSLLCQKIGIAFLYELHTKETFHMKCQAYFFLKEKKIFKSTCIVYQNLLFSVSIDKFAVS